MKHLLPLSLVLIFISGQALGIAIVPDRVVTPPLSIFHSNNKEVQPGLMSVVLSVFRKSGELRRSRDRINIPIEKYKNFKVLSSAVYEMIPNDRYPVDHKNKGRRGTAFHIGQNLVLTNAHVLSKGFRNTTHCADFELQVQNSTEKFKCKEVHFCDVSNDVCLIEMQNSHRGWGRNRVETSLSDGASLKLNGNWEPKLEDLDNTILTAIGNSNGFGIHLSQGRGAKKMDSIVFFWAPITVGNSGGPLLNEKGEVVGVIKQESGIKISNNPQQTFNVAASADIVIGLIREALRDDPATLEKFNQAVIE